MTESTEYAHRLKAFSLRMEEELRGKLEDEASNNARTLTSEINYRLQQSVEKDKERTTNEELKGMLAELLTRVSVLEQKLTR